MVKLTEGEKVMFSLWVIQNIDDQTVPSDEGNGDALIYNIIHQIAGDNKKYNYDADQDKEIETYDLFKNT